MLLSRASDNTEDCPIKHAVLFVYLVDSLSHLVDSLPRLVLVLRVVVC